MHCRLNIPQANQAVASGVCLGSSPFCSKIIYHTTTQATAQDVTNVAQLKHRLSACAQAAESAK